jgi:iron(III) transport system substrate-binding protein
MVKRLIGILVVIFLFITTVSCNNDEVNKNGVVVVYTSVDQNVSELIFDDFEKETGIVVKPVYDIEASKTTGLVNRLIAEKENPQADVFWSSEIIMTLRLEEEGILQPYISEKSLTIPDAYKDSKGYWTGFGGRARVMIINTDIMASGVYPDSVHDLTNKKYSIYKKAIAYPLFGTTMTHMFVMNQKWGENETIDYFNSAIENNTIIVDGNSVVRDLVASGEVAFGITDTDDAYGALRDGKPVEILYLDQDGEGTLLIPNTTGLINNCINTKEGKLFIDYLLNPETVDKLVEIGFIDISLQDENSGINFIECDFQEAYANSSNILNKIKENIIR